MCLELFIEEKVRSPRQYKNKHCVDNEFVLEQVSADVRIERNEGRV